MQTTEHTHDKIELRSEKVRNIIGNIPSGLTTWGLVIIVLMCLALTLVAVLVPYPHGEGETILQHLMRR